ncbi:unnamed protein product [Protopolystoma xenopodis]|uniref:Uncharacterized protein n=1 Tax=Protopolystoma xenopodis TaxID=117903 RepID=A0A448XHJ0_9PLAT|nr:unnamed protein product [Protopolystoma xenopodis]
MSAGQILARLRMCCWAERLCQTDSEMKTFQLGDAIGQPCKSQRVNVRHQLTDSAAVASSPPCVHCWCVCVCVCVFETCTSERDLAESGRVWWRMEGSSPSLCTTGHKWSQKGSYDDRHRDPSANLGGSRALHSACNKVPNLIELLAQ